MAPYLKFSFQSLCMYVHYLFEERTSALRPLPFRLFFYQSGGVSVLRIFDGGGAFVHYDHALAGHGVLFCILAHSRMYFTLLFSFKSFRLRAEEGPFLARICKGWIWKGKRGGITRFC